MDSFLCHWEYSLVKKGLHLIMKEKFTSKLTTVPLTGREGNEKRDSLEHEVLRGDVPEV